MVLDIDWTIWDVRSRDAQGDASGTIRWYLGDRQGSVRDLATAAGADAGHLAYDAFGDITAASANLTSAPAFAFDGMRLET